MDEGGRCPQFTTEYRGVQILATMKGEFSMSKNKKSKNEGIVPPNMSGRRFSALSDLGSALGFKPAEQPTPRSMKCRKCGKPMRQVPGTNVWVCDGMVEQEKDGVKKLVPCNNQAITGVDPRPQSSENPGDFKPKQKHRGKPSGKPAQAATA